MNTYTYADALLDDEGRGPIVSKRITPKASSKREKLLREMDEADRIANRDEKRRKAGRRRARNARKLNR